MLIALIVIVILAVLFFGAEYYIYRTIFKGPGRRHREGEVPAELSANPFEDEIRELTRDMEKLPRIVLHTRSRDGLRLAANYYPAGTLASSENTDGAEGAFLADENEKAPLDICFHGYKGSSMRDFGGTVPEMLRMGHSVLVVDERAHGGSGGKSLTLGIRERHDVKTWCDYAVKRFGDDVEISVHGISMGGATVLMASSLELPKNVKRILADCPYSSAEDILFSVMESMKLPAKLLLPFARLAGLLFAKADIAETTAADEVKNAKAPMLILHGEADGFVPADMSAEIAAANPALIERYTFPGAGHGLSYLTDPERYMRIVRAFYEKTGQLRNGESEDNATAP